VLHAVTARATVAGHASLVPLSCFPGPRRIRLALALLQSPDGHEVAAVEKEGLLESLKPHHTAAHQLQAALAALQTASPSSSTSSAASSSYDSPRKNLETAADPPMETPPRFLMGGLGTDTPTAGGGSAAKGSSGVRAGAGGGGGGGGVGVRMYSRGPISSADKTKVVATGHAARLALSCSPPGVSGALLHARYAVEWQTSGYYVDGIESQGRGLHVIWRHESEPSLGYAAQGLQGHRANEPLEHDIEAIDSVRIEGVECVLQVERDVTLEDGADGYRQGGRQEDRGVFLAIHDDKGQALLLSLVEGLHENPGLLNHRRILLPRAVYTY